VPIPAALLVAPPIPGATSNRPSISLTGGDGRFWDLTNLDSPVLLLPGMTGFDLPPASAFTVGTPGIAGASYQGSHDDPRPLFIPVYTEGSDRPDVVAVRRAFLESIHHTAGPVTVCVAEPDGFRRYLECIYTSGAEGAEGTDDAGLFWANYGLNFTAYDNPYWYGDVVTPPPWTIGTPSDFFPIGPALFTLSASQVFGGTLVDNTGNVETYPVWTLEGPATSLTLSLDGTARVFTINATIADGDSLTIDTDPRSQTVVDSNGDNRWDDVDDSALDLWALPRGVSAVTVTVGGGSANTKLSMSYQPRYLKS
jgi:hypothetical protein